MKNYHHHVSGFFARREQAEKALSDLRERGLPDKQLHIYSTDKVTTTPAQAKSDDALKDILVDGAIGTAVGTGIGALGEVALVAANVSLFIASPLLAPLVMMGWGASLGGLIGIAAGASPGSGDKKGWFSDLVGDAIAEGQVVLVAETFTQQETETAQTIIKFYAADHHDVNTSTV